jgi:hypothetical protein
MHIVYCPTRSWTTTLRDTVPIDSSLNLEPVSSHAGLVLLDQGLALLSRVIGFREQHAVIPGGLLGLADAAGLEIEMVRTVLSRRGVMRSSTYLGFLGGCWLGGCGGSLFGSAWGIILVFI